MSEKDNDSPRLLGLNEARFQEFIDSTVLPPRQLIAHVCQQITLVLPCDNGIADDKNNDLSLSLSVFIDRLIRQEQDQASTGALLASLVLLDRLRLRMCGFFSRANNMNRMRCTCRLLFLATLIITCKITKDAPLRNWQWAAYVDQIYSLKDINLMERQILSLLNYQLSITNEDLRYSFKVYQDSVQFSSVVLPSMNELMNTLLSTANHHQQHLPAPTALLQASRSPVLLEPLEFPITRTLLGRPNNANSSSKAIVEPLVITTTATTTTSSSSVISQPWSSISTVTVEKEDGDDDDCTSSYHSMEDIFEDALPTQPQQQQQQTWNGCSPTADASTVFSSGSSSSSFELVEKSTITAPIEQRIDST
ncbi:MAG: hypothetical protein EXX96DRAFT_555969 [Benjaminiella poitrasii]|nr:MAG: hypothetical protein EXX96DRAFT_555969 [Benjaminiella poitrasii]